MISPVNATADENNGMTTNTSLLYDGDQNNSKGLNFGDFSNLVHTFH